MKVILEPITHTYWDVDVFPHRQVPGVSHILEVSGAKGNNPFEIHNDFYSTRGHYAHKAAALDHAGVLDEGTVDPRILGYLKAIRRFKDETGFVPVEWDVVVWDEDLYYAGTYDLGGYFPHTPEQEILIDLKSGSKAKWHEYQTAGYVLARHKDRWQRIKAGPLYVRDNGRYTLDLMSPITLAEGMSKWQESVMKAKQMKEGGLW